MNNQDKTQPSPKLRRAKKIISKLPDAPGVYFFKRGKKILYIGKATSLKDRVRSYFSAGIESSRGPLISKMISKFDGIAFKKTDSVLEALVLEASLIKKHQPPANIKEKDNSSFNYVVITDEDFPQILVMRGRELEIFFKPSSRENPREERRQRTKENFSKNFPWFSRDAAKKNIFSIKKTFGPFPNGSQLREAMKIVRRMFPYRDNKCIPYDEQIKSGKKIQSCFNRHIGLCPGVCTGEISKEDYAKQIKNIVLFFEGNKKKLIKTLQKEMKDFAKKREFEKAQEVKNKIYALYHIQDVSLIKSEKLQHIPLQVQGESLYNFRIESYDIAHLSGTNVVGVMTVVEDSEIKKSDYRKFKIKTATVDDTKALSEVLTRRLNHPEWPFPNLIVVDGGKQQKNAMEKVLKERSLNIPVVSVVKDERHKPKEILDDSKSRIGEEKIKVKYEKEILLSNTEAHRFAISFHRYRRGKMF